VLRSTTAKVDVVGFNVITIDSQGRGTLLNPVPIGCEECVTGVGHTYFYILPKHKSGHNVYIEMLRQKGAIAIGGPAVREMGPISRSAVPQGGRRHKMSK
jgi:hypothetical protein